MLSLGQAATEVGVSKSTLTRAIKNGRMSANRTDLGGYEIDPAELFRCYPPRNGSTGGSTPAMTRHTTTDAPPDATVATAALQTEVRLLREMLDEMRGQRDSWQKQAEARLLTDQHPQVAPPVRRGFFGWLKAG